MTTARDILLKILEAIDYSDNHEVFVAEFLRLTYLQTLTNLVKSLPFDKQTAINQELAKSADNPELIASTLKKQFSQQELDKALETAAKDAVTEFIQTIIPTLSPAQKEKLLQVMEEAGQTPAA